MSPVGWLQVRVIEVDWMEEKLRPVGEKGGTKAQRGRREVVYCKKFINNIIKLISTVHSYSKHDQI